MLAFQDAGNGKLDLKSQTDAKCTICKSKGPLSFWCVLALWSSALHTSVIGCLQVGHDWRFLSHHCIAQWSYLCKKRAAWYSSGWVSQLSAVVHPLHYHSLSNDAVNIVQHVKRSLENSACTWAASAYGCLVFLHKQIWLCRSKVMSKLHEHSVLTFHQKNASREKSDRNRKNRPDPP